MALTIPPSKNYQSPLVAVPSLMQDEPVEGRKQVPCEVTWSTALAGAGKTISFNLQNNATLDITQISTIKVDNSGCGADVTFIFPDTNDTITIPAGTPDVVAAVFSNGRMFYVTAPNSLDTDVTRFQLLNYRMDPADIPLARNQQATKAAFIDFGTPPPLDLISTAINGTLNSANMNYALTPTGVPGAVQHTVLLKDNRLGTPTFTIPIPIAADGSINSMSNVLKLEGLNLRFKGGVWLDFTTSGVGNGSQLLGIFLTYLIP
jgi:hypothetical protein